MEVETVVETAAPPGASEVSDQEWMNMVMGEDAQPVKEDVTPEVTPETKPEVKADTDADATPEKEVDGEQVQLSKADYMRLMNLEAKQRMAQGEVPATPEVAATATPDVVATPATPAISAWTPEVTPIPVRFAEHAVDKYVNAFAFESKEQGEAVIGDIVNFAYTNAAQYTQNAIAAATNALRQEFAQQMQQTQTFSHLAPALVSVFDKLPEYLDYPDIVHEVMQSVVKENPTMHITKVANETTKRLEENMKKVSQIMKSGGKINAVPQGGAKAATTGARAPQDNGRNGEPKLTAQEQALKDLGYTGF